MAFGYPISLDLTSRRCIVIGGDKLAEEKVGGLLYAGAHVRVVTPVPSAGLRELAARGEIELVVRDYRPGDLDGAFLAIAATGDSALNEMVHEEAENERVLLNSVDDVDHCHFAAPAIVRRGDLAVSISTAGKAPALAKKLRRELDALLGPEYGALVDVLHEVRQELLPREVDFDTWANGWQRALRQDLLSLARAGRFEEVKQTVRDAVTAAGTGESRGGWVALVGAGPGDPSLITVRGRDLLARADIVVHDRLVHPGLLEGKRAVYAGKDPHGSSTDQAHINFLLVKFARAGHDVVRLKGGDPFVFGRGAEEAAALAAAGIEYEVVPAPTSAFAALTAAGIPMTDRNASSSVAVVTGRSAGDTPVQWRALARAVDTIVVLMGLGSLDRITHELVAGGLDRDTPAAVIEKATWPDQRVVTSTLSGLARATNAAQVGGPAVIVIGRVVDALGRAPAEAGASHDSRVG